VIENPKKPSNR
jgi:hypothetical protein